MFCVSSFYYFVYFYFYFVVYVVARYTGDIYHYNFEKDSYRLYRILSLSFSFVFSIIYIMGYLIAVTKTVVKCSVPPPVAVAMDITEGLADLAAGNFVGAVVCFGCAGFSLIPGGKAATTAGKTLLGFGGKAVKAVAEVEKQTAKTITKEIGQQVSKKIAVEGLKGAAKRHVVEGGKTAASLFVKGAQKEILTKGMVKATVDTVTIKGSAKVVKTGIDVIRSLFR